MSDERSRRYDRAAGEAATLAGVLGAITALTALGAALVYSSAEPGRLPSGWVVLLGLLAVVLGAFSAVFAGISYRVGIEAEIERLPTDPPPVDAPDQDS